MQARIKEKQHSPPRKLADAVYQYSLDAILLVDDHGRYLDANPAACKLLGYDLAELRRLSVWDVTSPLEREHSRELWDSFVAAGNAEGRCTLIAKDGSRIEVGYRAVANIQPELHLLILRDITELKRAERLLAGRNKLLDRLVTGPPLQEMLMALIEGMEQAAPDLLASILILDRENGVLRYGASRSLPEFYNCAMDGLKIGPTAGSCGSAAHWGKRVIAEDILTDPCWVDLKEIAVRAGFRSCWSEPILGSSGHVLGTVSMYGREPQSPDAFNLRLLHAIAQVAAIAIDRNNALEAVRKSEATFHQAFDTAAIGMAVVGIDGRYLTVNDAFCRMLGYSECELLAIKVTDTTHIEDRPQDLELYGQLRSGQKTSARLSKRYITKNGEIVMADVSVALIRDSKQEPLHIVSQIQDITAQRLNEDRLGDYASRLRELSKRLLEIQEVERRKLVQELHDECGQLLTGLKLDIEKSLLNSTVRNRASLGDALDRIVELMKHVRELSLTIRPAMLDDLGLLPTLIWHLGRYRNQTGVCVAFEHTGLQGKRFRPELETAAYRIVQEALTNVARYAGVREAHLEVWLDPDKLNFRIEDKGAGFEYETIMQNGRGAGLTGMRERAASLQGSVVIESNPGTGTCILAELPLVQGQE